MLLGLLDPMGNDGPFGVIGKVLRQPGGVDFDFLGRSRKGLGCRIVVPRPQSHRIVFPAVRRGRKAHLLLCELPVRHQAVGLRALEPGFDPLVDGLALRIALHQVLVGPAVALKLLGNLDGALVV